MSKRKVLLVAAMTVLMAACSKKEPVVDGSYVGDVAHGFEMVKTSYTFGDDGRVLVGVIGAGTPIAQAYFIDGNKITVGDREFFKQDDGSLRCADGSRLVKLNGVTTQPQGQTAAAVSGDTPDLSRPVASYAQFSPTEQGAMTKLVIALANPPLSDDEKLGLLSARYYNERDAFKKHDIATAELPAINADLARVQGMRYLAVPLLSDSYMAPGIWLSAPTLKSYDFSTQSFPIANNNANDCWGYSFTNNQNVRMTTSNTSLPCALKVSDETVARGIEAANKSGDLSVKGTAYLYIGENIGDQSLWGKVTHAHVELWKKSTNEKLSVFDI